MKRFLINAINYCIQNRAFFKRILMSLLTLFCAMIFGFLCIKMMPGNVVEMYAKNLMYSRNIPYDNAYRLAVQILNYDPDVPVVTQLLNYLNGVLHGDFGTSLNRNDITTVRIIRQCLPWTLLISGLSLIISFFLGIMMGGYMAGKRKGLGSVAGSTYIVVSGAIPDYLFGMLLIIVFGVRLGWFPKSGNYDLMLQIKGMNPVVNILYHAALPIIAYSFVQTGAWALSMRGSAIGVLGEDYIYAARVRGIPERRIRRQYVRRNAMLPLVTSFAISFGAIFGGAPLMEAIFNYPGFGVQFNNYIGNRDYFIIQGMMVFMCFMIILANFIADSAYSLVDPRIRRET